MTESRIQIIVVTDGDETAQQAIEVAAKDLELFPLKASGGNPSPLSGPEVLQLILDAPFDPVVVMVDDHGKRGPGPGERVLEFLFKCRHELDILGVIAVASDTRVRGIHVDLSVTADGKIITGPVGKNGRREERWHNWLEGDTVEILRQHPGTLIIGCGDLGKMEGQDRASCGAAITRRCLREILNRSGKKIV